MLAKIAQGPQDQTLTQAAANQVTGQPGGRPTPSRLPQVAVIEDNAFMLEAWVDTLQIDAQVYAFSSPEELFAALAAESGLLSQLTCVITDLYFDNSHLSGVEVAAQLRANRVDLPILLCTDGYFGSVKDTAIDRIISKIPVSFECLREDEDMGDLLKV